MIKDCQPKKFFSHILFNGFCPGYTTWTFHGEHVSSEYDTSYIRNLVSKTTNVPRDTLSQTDALRDMLHAALETSLGGDQNYETGDTSEDQTSENVEGQADIPPSKQHHGDEMSGADASQYKKLLAECDKELYPGCKYSQLYFNLTLIHIKCMGGLSNKCFGMLLEFLKDIFPFLTSLPTSAYEAKRMCNDLGLGYEKIHSCPNDCMLYWRERADQNTCHVCGSSRWKFEDNDKDKDEIANEIDEQANWSCSATGAVRWKFFRC